MSIQFKSDFPVELIQYVGSDEIICQAARVSTLGWDSLDSAEAKGLLSFLIKNRHGSPLEHTLMTWRISAPIFVWRELMRHRIASYSEESARYKQLEAVFYVPPADRPLSQVGKPGAYTYVPGTDQDRIAVGKAIQRANLIAYDKYEEMLTIGIAREVARMVLPVNIYSSAWVSMNVRGLMNFLSLRTKDEGSLYKSFPQWEIEQVALQMEKSFVEHFPIVADLFRKAGSVCP